MDGADARLLNGWHGCKTAQWMMWMKRLQDSLMDGVDEASAKFKDEWRLCVSTLATEWSPLMLSKICVCSFLWSRVVI